jgi:hypothetical protein
VLAVDSCGRRESSPIPFRNGSSSCGMADMQRALIALGALMATLLVGCGGGTNTSARGGTSTLSPGLATTQAPKSNASTTERRCGASHARKLRALAADWQLVVASDGASHHPRYVIAFKKDVKRTYDAYEKEPVCKGTKVMILVSQLRFKASLLSLPFELSPARPASPDADYARAARLGNRLFKVAGITRGHFIPMKCTGKVDKTPVCTGSRSRHE